MQFPLLTFGSSRTIQTKQTPAIQTVPKFSQLQFMADTVTIRNSQQTPHFGAGGDDENQWERQKKLERPSLSPEPGEYKNRNSPSTALKFVDRSLIHHGYDPDYGPFDENYGSIAARAYEKLGQNPIEHHPGQYQEWSLTGRQLYTRTPPAGLTDNDVAFLRQAIRDQALKHNWSESYASQRSFQAPNGKSYSGAAIRTWNRPPKNIPEDAFTQMQDAYKQRRRQVYPNVTSLDTEVFKGWERVKPDIKTENQFTD